MTRGAVGKCYMPGIIGYIMHWKVQLRGKKRMYPTSQLALWKWAKSTFWSKRWRKQGINGKIRQIWKEG